MVLIHNSSLRSFIEFYAVIPAVLLALAGTYKFGYFHAFDALWVLPSISVQSLFYSILATALLFTVGNLLSLLYLNLSSFFGHLYMSLGSMVLIVLFIIFVGLKSFLSLSIQMIPLYFGIFYYVYVHYSMFGNELERSITTPLTLLLSAVAFIGMFGSGVADAKRAMNDNILPIVLFEQQSSYPNDNTDWRLLEAIDSRFVLINLKNGSEKRGFEMKVVDYSKVDGIY